MSDDVLKHPASTFQEAPSWSPSSTLHARLLLGVLAVLAGSALSVTGTILALMQNNLMDPGFTLARGLQLAGSLLLLVVFLVYHRLGTEVESPSLKKTSVCLGLILLIGSLLEFADPAMIPQEWATGFLVAGGLGLVILIPVAFLYPRPHKTDAPEEAASETADKAKAGVGIGGGVLFMIFIGLKFGARLLWRQGGGLGFEEYLGIAWFVFMLLAVIFFIWFGAAKIRLRIKLGSLGLVLGLYEILMALAVIVAAGMLIVALVGVEQPNLNAQQVDQAMNEVIEAWVRVASQVQIGIEIIWALLTACFFVTLRNRHEPAGTMQPAGS